MNIEDNIENGACSSSPILPPQSEMDIFLENKSTQKELKQQKIYKIEQAKILLCDIIKVEFNNQVQSDLIEGINYLEFLIQKIRNPLIQSPRQSALNELNSKIFELNKKIDSIQFEKNIIKNNDNKAIENINFPPSPQVIIPKFNKEIIALEDSIHNKNNFQEVKSKKKNQANKNIINKHTINNNSNNNIIN